MALLAQGAAEFCPMFAAQHHRYLLRESVNISDSSRSNSHAEMVKAIKPHTQAEPEAVADRRSRLPPLSRQAAESAPRRQIIPSTRGSHSVSGGQ